jgi:formamidopyrimidine-DNA glycosylase
MPEGVEIRKFASIINNNAVGHNITGINILKGRYIKKVFDGYNELLNYLPVKIVNIKTKGKFTYIELHSIKNNKTFWLFNTLGLTGGWTISNTNKDDFKMDEETGTRFIKKSDLIYIYPTIWEFISNNSLSEWFEKAIEHLNVEFILDTGARIYFYDQLSFGTLKIISNQKDLTKKLNELGYDIMDDSTTFEIFKKQLQKSNNKQIGNVIVNQKLISGIGNYLRADALWMSKISPFRIVSNITDIELELLYKSIRGLMWGDLNYNEAIQKGYIHININSNHKKNKKILVSGNRLGKIDMNSWDINKITIPRDYNREFFVYKQSTDLFGNIVNKKELYEGNQKRFIYYVPEIQK